MRKLIAGLFVTLDGVTEAPEQWQGPYMNEEVGRALGQCLGEADTLLLGRRTYEKWAAYWPSAGEHNPFAAQINAMPKAVVSKTLTTAAWENPTVLAGDPIEEVAALKAQDGRNILINGSTTLVRALLRKSLVDELQLLLHPVAVGHGSRLFEDGTDRLELDRAQAFANGVVSLNYVPAGVAVGAART
jgi:dihydrofolate reductase